LCEKTCWWILRLVPVYAPVAEKEEARKRLINQWRYQNERNFNETVT
jgi:hypothetical protein